MANISIHPLPVQKQPKARRIHSLICLAVVSVLVLLAACAPVPQPDTGAEPVESQATLVIESSVEDAPVSSPLLEMPSQAPPDPSPDVPAGQTAAPLTVTAVTPPTLPPTATTTPTPEFVVRFAVIGDYGAGSQAETDVAALVKSWEPDLILTVGDNNYPSGSYETIDHNIGRDYQEFIHPYTGVYGEGADMNRFFPTLGNHDWMTDAARPYLDYFTLPGNERYYDFTWGPVHFFAIDSDSNEPDGVSRTSFQAEWLQEKMAASTLPWQVVYFHHAPYSSGLHGPVEWMRWPFEEWGADAVLTGHDHTYERLLIGGIPYFVNGVGGGAIYDFKEISEGSQFRYNADYGAMLVTADVQQMTLEFYNRQGELLDTLTVPAR